MTRESDVDGSNDIDPGQDPWSGPRRRPRGPDLGAVLGGLVLVAVAAALATRELLGATWDWKWWAAGVLVLTGFAVVVSSVVSAALAGRRPS